MRSLVCELKLKHIWVVDQYNDQKYTGNTSLNGTITKVSLGLSQGLDLNLIAKLYFDFIQAVHA